MTPPARAVRGSERTSYMPREPRCQMPDFSFYGLASALLLFSACGASPPTGQPGNGSPTDGATPAPDVAMPDPPPPDPRSDASVERNPTPPAGDDAGASAPDVADAGASDSGPVKPPTPGVLPNFPGTRAPYGNG